MQTYFSGIAGEDRGQLLPDMSQRKPAHTNSAHWQGEEGKLFGAYRQEKHEATSN